MNESSQNDSIEQEQSTGQVFRGATRQALPETGAPACSRLAIFLVHRSGRVLTMPKAGCKPALPRQCQVAPMSSGKMQEGLRPKLLDFPLFSLRRVV
jgi:hypothetical protein